jgi:uncharacterized membrane protein YgcG
VNFNYFTLCFRLSFFTITTITTLVGKSSAFVSKIIRSNTLTQNTMAPPSQINAIRALPLAAGSRSHLLANGQRTPVGANEAGDRPVRTLALAAHTRGVLAGPCSRCAGERVVHFAECVVLPGYMQGKCTNCHYANDSRPCIMPASDDDNDSDDDDDDDDDASSPNNTAVPQVAPGGPIVDQVAPGINFNLALGRPRAWVDSLNNPAHDDGEISVSNPSVTTGDEEISAQERLGLLRGELVELDGKMAEMQWAREDLEEEIRKAEADVAAEEGEDEEDDEDEDARGWRVRRKQIEAKKGRGRKGKGWGNRRGGRGGGRGGGGGAGSASGARGPGAVGQLIAA